jgi:uncharacterized protein
MGEEVSTREYLQLDDTDLTFHLKQWARDGDALLSDLASRFVHRRLFKAVDLDIATGGAEALLACADDVIRRAGFDPKYYLIMDRAADIPYYGYYSPVGVDPKSLIYIETGGPHSVIREISEVSEVVRGMRGYRIDRLCFPAEVSDEMSRLISEHAGASPV